MIVLAKSSVKSEQFMDKINKGAKYIEIQLFMKDIQTKEDVYSIFKTVKETGANVRAVHIPIDLSYKFEGLINPEVEHVFYNTFSLAQKISDDTKERTYVVIHPHLNVRQLKAWGLYPILKNILYGYLTEFQDIVIVLENEPCFLNDGPEYNFMNDNYYLEVPELVRELRKDLNTDRIGAVLDTSHAHMSVNFLQRDIEKGIHRPISMKDYFYEYSDILYEIHLANTRDYGEDGEGVGFDTEEELKNLEMYMQYIKEIGFDGLLTLEVCEKDYTDAQIFLQTFKQVNKILKEW